jgi:peptide/nickel transport system permease protein
VNKALIIGIVLLLLFMILAIAGPSLAPYAPDYDEKIRKTDSGYFSPPFSPDSAHLMGTDLHGFDIFTLLLHGAGYTIFFCFATAISRVIIGTTGALIIEKGHIPGIKLLHGFSAIPSVVFVYFILINITFNSVLTPWRLAVYQGMVLTLVGIPGSYSMMQGRIEEIKKSAHIEAAISYGSGWIHMVKKHIAPFLVEPILIALGRESISILVIMG